MARHGSRVDEMTALAMRLDERREHFHAMHDAHQIDVDDPAPILQRNLAGLAAQPDAGIIGHDVNLAEMIDGRLRCLLDLAGVCNIADH